MNIEGTPKTLTAIQYTPTFQGFGTPTNVKTIFYLNGSELKIDSEFTTGTNTGVEARHGLPGSLTIDSNLGNTGPVVVGSCGLVNAATVARYILATASNSYLNFGIQSASFSANVVRLGNDFASATRTGFTALVTVNQMSNVPLKDR